MKKLKSIVSVIIAVFALEAICTAHFISEKTEISFKVGDSTLNINGEDVNVETPYVVGEGVTLVPVRVITEAFGAEVGWDGAERKVTLTTEEKKIELWIGKTDATMNGEKLTLLSAPEISNNVTMVPLRFISEGFGADVSYDNKTKQITVSLDKGPVVENGVKFFDDGIVSLPVPEDYHLVKSQDLQYKFSKNVEYNYNDYDTVWSYVFSVPCLSDAETVLKNDRDNQIELIRDKKYVVSSVEKNTFGDIEAFSYNVSYMKNTSSFLRIKKTLYSFGGYSYLTISAYDAYYNTGKLIKQDEKLISIDYASYKISVPEEFSACEDIKAVPFDISGKANPEISVRVFAKDEGFDAKAYLEDKENSYRYIVEQRNINASRVKEYTFGDKTYYGLELSYINGGKIYNILLEYEDYIAFFEFQQDNFENAEEVILNFELCEKVLSKLKKPDEKNFVIIETESFTFELPSDFELESLENSDYVYGIDTQTSMFFNSYDGIKTVANESYDYSTDSDFNPMFPKIYTTISRKRELADVTLDTIELYKNDGWIIEYNERRHEDIKLNGEYIEIHMDEIVCQKSIGNNVDLYQKIIYIFTDTDEYEISMKNARVERINEIVENNDFEKEYDMPDQKVHAFVFTYTNMSNEKYINELCESIIDSIKLK